MGRARSVLLTLGLCFFLALYFLRYREDSVVLWAIPVGSAALSSSPDGKTEVPRRFTPDFAEVEAPLHKLTENETEAYLDATGVPLVDDNCKCCDWQNKLVKRWTALRANKTFLLLRHAGGGLGTSSDICFFALASVFDSLNDTGNQFQGWITAAMISMVLDRAFILDHYMREYPNEQLSTFFRSRWWPFAPTTEDRLAVVGHQIIEYPKWYSWLQEKRLDAFRSHFPREGPIILHNDSPSLAAILGAPEIVEKVRKTMGGINEDKILPCMANFLFTSLAERLQLKAKDLLMAIDHSGPGPHSSVSVGVHIRLGDEVLLSKYQQAGKHGASVGDKRPFNQDKILGCLDKLIASIEGRDHALPTTTGENSTAVAGDHAGTGKKVILFVASDSTSVYDLFIERYGAQRVLITPGEPFHIARAVDDPQLLDLDAARDKAYMDWFLLSKVDLLVHNFRTTYSTTAGGSSLHTQQVNSEACEISRPLWRLPTPKLTRPVATPSPTKTPTKAAKLPSPVRTPPRRAQSRHRAIANR